jgi:hypothetical protein
MLGVVGMTDILEMNALTSLFSLCVNGVAIALFAQAGLVRWPYALAMAGGALAGGDGATAPAAAALGRRGPLLSAPAPAAAAAAAAAALHRRRAPGRRGSHPVGEPAPLRRGGVAPALRLPPVAVAVPGEPIRPARPPVRPRPVAPDPRRGDPGPGPAVEHVLERLPGAARRHVREVIGGGHPDPAVLLRVDPLTVRYPGARDRRRRPGGRRSGRCHVRLIRPLRLRAGAGVAGEDRDRAAGHGEETVRTHEPKLGMRGGAVRAPIRCAPARRSDGRGRAPG